MDIQEVARQAKVSTATVSRVINNLPSVRPVTHAHVMRVIEKLNYVPNTSARYLRVGHTKLFGLIVSDIKNPFFPDLIDSFEAMATKHGIDVIFTHTHYDPKRFEHCLRRMLDRNVDGIAVMTSEVDIPTLERVKRSKKPFVLLNQATLGKRFENISVEYTSGFQEAVEHLRKLGHSSIAFIAGPESLSSAARRRKAFQSALAKCRLKVSPECIVSGELNAQGGYTAMQKLLHVSPRPTAVIATSDLMAIGAMQAAQEAGLHVPEDMSVIGFDDLPISTMVNPPLTTIGLSRHEIAERAFSVLLNASGSGKKKKLEKRAILPRLVVRGSTGPPLKERRT